MISICVPSNCGKTNVLISLLESPNGVRFENVYVYSKSLQQPKYRYLENLFTPIDEIGYFTFSNNSDVVPPSEARPNSIFIFDDVACDKQDAVREYFSMESLENVFETTEDSLATKIQNQLQTSEGREALRADLGPLGQKYVEAVLRGVQDKESGIDHVYGIYLHKDGLMFGNKRFDVDDADNIIIYGVRYASTPDLYEWIFKRIPDNTFYTEDDMHKYKSMLLVTNAHKHKYHSQGHLLSNRGYKYKHNRVSMKRFSRVTSARKNTLFSRTQCITRRIMKKKSEKKREKISSERRRLIEELHAPARRNFPRRHVIVRGYDDLWQVDVVEMRPYSGFNRGHHYILTVIDVLSKYAWAVPLKSKGGSETANAISKIVRESRRCPKNLQTDMGKEFYNADVQKILKKHDVNHYSTYSTLKTGYTPNWTTEVFTIVKVQRTNPVTYLLEDYRGKSVTGAFYEYELHRATHPDMYLVEKVLRRLGFDGTYNSWIHKNNVI
ncbi:YMD3 protein, partial [Pseudoatta argentina]